ncbi:hypothetical protein [Pimelobacter sp. 30-1]|uniref:hypothetical protein n=1 Tax=Pimelobacter sp. 30-1 TaxID=2004991 RepID=UPI001C053E9F|nr:hypothetical protein [Pimelobacter sp. 30-1]MBU2698104.1 hypothetical protein [Pimelobacter sp. 30-1]
MWSVHFTAFDCLKRRIEQAKKVRALVAQRPTGAIPIVVGDLNNTTPKCSSPKKKGKPIRLLDLASSGAGAFDLNPTVAMKAACSSANATFNTGWNTRRSDDRSRWDYIFADQGLTVSGVDIHKQWYDLGSGTTSPSDHYAVSAVLAAP